MHDVAYNGMPQPRRGDLWGWSARSHLDPWSNGMTETSDDEDRTPNWWEPMRARRGPCSHFLRKNRCMYGDGCKYSHTMPAAADLTPRRAQDNNTVLAPTRNKEEVCPYYLNGNCSYGEDCYFSHPKPPSSSASQHNFPSYNGTNGRQTNCAAYPTDCTLGCAEAIQYCHRFFKKGRCKFADRCALLHEHPTARVEVDCRHEGGVPYGMQAWQSVLSQDGEIRLLRQGAPVSPFALAKSGRGLNVLAATSRIE